MILQLIGNVLAISFAALTCVGGNAQTGSRGTDELAHPPVTREELLQRVNPAVLAKAHHVDVTQLKLFRLRIFLSIDAVLPTTPKDGDLLVVNYTLTNFTLQQAQGIVAGLYAGKPMINLDGSQPVAVNLAPGG